MLKEGTIVEVYNLGDDAVYKGVIRGVSSSFAEMYIYILEMIDWIPGQTYSHITMTSTCIREIWK